MRLVEKSVKITSTLNGFWSIEIRTSLSGTKIANSTCYFCLGM